MKKMIIKKSNSKKKNKYLVSTALILSLILDDAIDTNKLVVASDIVYITNNTNSDETVEKLQSATVFAGLSANTELIELANVKKEIVESLANKFSKLYGVSNTECFELINDNVDYILSEKNAIDELTYLIRNNIVDGNLTIVENKDNMLNAGKGNINYVNDFKNTSRGKIYKKYASMYGVDYNFALALAKQESNLDHEGHLPGGNSFNGYGHGISQVENSLFNTRFTAFNFETNREETYEIVEEYPSERESGVIYLSVMNFEDNVRIGVAKLQSKLRKYNYNILMALQAYNYGDGSFMKVLKAYSSQTGRSVEEIINNKNDLGWIDYVLDLHNNPSKYIDNWKYDTYGDGSYIKHVAQYFTEFILEFKTDDNKMIYVNVYDLTSVEIDNCELIKLKNSIDNIDDFAAVKMETQSINTKSLSKVLSLKK